MMKAKLSKQITSFVLALLMVLGCAPVAVYAETEYTYGNYTYTVSGKDATIIAYPEAATGSVSIPTELNGYTVRKIGAYAFYACTNLTEITVSNTVTEIGNYAFAYCISLSEIEIPSSVTSIGANAFKNSNNVTVKCEEGSYAKKFAEEQGISTDTGGVVNKDTAASDGTTISLSKDVYEYKIGEEFPLSGELYSPKGTSGITLNWSVTDTTGVTISTPASMLNTDATHIIFSALATGKKVGNYTVTVKTSNGASSSRTIEILSKDITIVGRTFDVGLDYYADNWSSSSYNANLANMLCALAAAVYKPSDIEDAYSSLNFKSTDYNLYDYDGFFDSSRCGYSLGFKKADSGDYTICLVSARGSSNVSDWVGNIALATFEDEKHIGFAYPANHIYDKIQSAVKSKGITGKIKYFITGHSRGAAVANLLAVKLMENGVSSSLIYNYNFACPDVACKYWFTKYSNIFNLCNREDPVPFVPGNIASTFTSPGTSWGKFGTTYWFTKDAPGTVNPFKDHDIWLYLDFFDQRKNPDTWETSFRDKADDAKHKLNGWITKVLCPVDVMITDNGGKNIASVINGRVNYYDSTFGNVIILTDGDKKVVYINGDREFKVNLIGTATGKMTYSVEGYNLVTDEISNKKTFENVTLVKGKEMSSPVSDAINTNDIKLYVIDEKDGRRVVTREIDVDGSERKVEATGRVQSVSVNNLSVSYKATTTIMPTVIADEGVNYTVTYQSSNSKVATIDEDGNIYAAKKGNATITVTVADQYGNVIKDTCTVTVKYTFIQWIIMILLFGWIWY